MIRPGRMSQKISIERVDSGADSFGEALTTWSTLAVRWASIEPLVGREYMVKSGENSEVTTRIRLRYDSTVATITTADRVNHNGVLYDIDSPPINPQMRNSEIILMCVLNERHS